ncbi:MAG: GMC oxidoreductase [Dongiales bacterium]
MEIAPPDILIVGSGIGGATMAAGLAPSGAQILILERGERLTDSAACRDARAIFQQGVFRPKEVWHDAGGAPFNPGNYYYVGGNSKFYGAVLIRFRREDFAATEHEGGVSPAWPITYDDLEPYYGQAEALFQVRGRHGVDPTEPPASTDYPFPPIPDEPAIAETRARLARLGLHPFSLPLAVDIERWVARAPTPWDAFPNIDAGKFDAETGPLAQALAFPNVRLVTGAKVRRLIAEAGSGRIAEVEYESAGETRRLAAGMVVLAAGAVNSAILLLASADARHPDGLANRSDQIGRNFMNHNSSAMLAIDPRLTNDSVYQKTVGLNDFYLDDGRGGPALGNVQLLGRVSGAILKGSLRRVPEFLLNLMSRHAVDWYLMSEDLPRPESRVRLEGGQIRLDWQRSNMAPHARLATRMREIFRAASFPIVLTKEFDKRTPSHQCGTVRFGSDPAAAPLDPYCRAWDHPNLFVVDAGFLPSSAAVNPALTIAAQALRSAEHIRRQDLRA